MARAHDIVFARRMVCADRMASVEPITWHTLNPLPAPIIFVVFPARRAVLAADVSADRMHEDLGRIQVNYRSALIHVAPGSSFIIQRGLARVGTCPHTSRIAASGEVSLGPYKVVTRTCRTQARGKAPRGRI